MCVCVRAALFAPHIAKEANKLFKRLWMCCHCKHKRVKTAGPPALTIVLQQVRATGIGSRWGRKRSGTH